MPTLVTKSVSTNAPGDKWRTPGSGRRYARDRWAHARRAAIDPRIVGALAKEHGFAGGPCLDVGCGPGRLRPELVASGAHWIGLDASAAMLDEASIRAPGSLLRGLVEKLPVRDGAVELVVACRLLHHFQAPEAFDRAIAELVRVSARLVIFSFWDSASLPAVRRRIGLARDEGPTGRVSRTRSVITESVSRAGARVAEFRSVLRFLSQQTFAVLEKRA